MAPADPAQKPRFAKLPRALPPSIWMLPDAQFADEDGVVGIGADLAASTLVDAYSRGIFPWPHTGIPLPWFSPDPRGVLPVGDVHISRSLRRRLRSSGWYTTLDTAFEDVVEACGQDRGEDGTWITDALVSAYRRLHELGWAHSLEVWAGDELVGGVYGVQIGAAFTGESMFHRVTDASKAALVDLVHRFRMAGGELFDVQLTTRHLRSLGAIDVPRSRFLEELASLREAPVRMETSRLPVRRLIDERGAAWVAGAASATPVVHTGRAGA